MIKERAYAKINLALEVKNKVDGYHMVNNIMVPIDLYDELSFTKDNDIYVLNDNIENNICIKAAKLFIDEFNINNGVLIKLNKNIPMAAGLAGGSSDAAAVLRGLNKLYNVNASNDKLKELSSKLGSDVPFFIETKAALCTNRGEVINPLNIEVPKISVLLIKPNTGLSTKEVYQNYVNLNVDKKDKIDNIIKALSLNDVELLKNNIFNDLGISALSLNKELNYLYNIIKEKNINIYISGSGPTMYLIDPTEKEEQLIKELISDDVFLYKCTLF